MRYEVTVRYRARHHVWIHVLHSRCGDDRFEPLAPNPGTRRPQVIRGTVVSPVAYTLEDVAGWLHSDPIIQQCLPRDVAEEHAVKIFSLANGRLLRRTTRTAPYLSVRGLRGVRALRILRDRDDWYDARRGLADAAWFYEVAQHEADTEGTRDVAYAIGHPDREGTLPCAEDDHAPAPALPWTHTGCRVQPDSRLARLVRAYVACCR
jgi:hypothetical protein